MVRKVSLILFVAALSLAVAIPVALLTTSSALCCLSFSSAPGIEELEAL
jgi:hypothetical protein